MKTFSALCCAVSFVGFALTSCSSETPETPIAPPVDTTTIIAPPTPPPAPELPVAKSNQGIDISHHNGVILWDSVSATKISFAYTKVSEGLGVDPRLETNWPEMKAAGLLRGGYHFYYTGDDPVAQAKHYCEKMGPLGIGDLRPMLDLENGIFPKDLDRSTIDKKELAGKFIQFLDEVEKTYGVVPIIYTNHPFGNEYLTDTVFAKYPLWIAEYTKGEIKIPSTWEEEGYVIWQNESDDYLNGIKGKVDHDFFNGHPSELVSKIGITQ